MKLLPPSISEKVEFLRRPETYPENTSEVEVRETHMSWLFLTARDAWKLKKPARNQFLNFSTCEARRRNCVREVELNRRLAPDTYRGLVRLGFDSSGRLQLGAAANTVDWLVHMRRLPADRMFDGLIYRHAVTDDDLSKLCSTLFGFYENSAPAPITGLHYRRQLAGHLRSARIELTDPNHGFPSQAVNPIIQRALSILQNRAPLLDARTRGGYVIEAHGDLRPEHICLEEKPVIIDCLEFNSGLRTLDVVSELTFLALECERLGAPAIGKAILHAYLRQTGDRITRELRAFYRLYHSCIRAKLALAHLRHPGSDVDKWKTKARSYLAMIEVAASAA